MYSLKLFCKSSIFSVPVSIFAPAMAAVTIVTGGLEDVKAFDKKLEKMKETGWWYADVRDSLQKDPADKVSPGEDYRSSNCIRVVVGQEQFPDVVDQVLQSVHNGYRMIFINCRSGKHRAATVGATCESLLNVMLDQTGSRLYNAMLFTLHDNNATWGVWAQQVDRAVEWSRGPWMEASSDELYGYRASRGSPNSCQNFDAMMSMVISTSLLDTSVVTEKMYKQLAAGSSESKKPVPPVPKKPSYPPPFQKAWPKDTVEPPTKKQKSDVQLPSSQCRPSVSSASGSSGPQDEVKSGLPDWATFQSDVRVWWELFDYWGLDTDARQSLFLLSQTHWKEANRIVWTLLKKKVDGHHVGNPSGFVYSSVMNSWHAKN